MRRERLCLAALAVMLAGATEGAPARNPIDAKWIAALRLNESFFRSEYLPAYSSVKKSAALLHQSYSCCISSDILFLTIAVGKEEPSEAILVWPSDEVGTVLTKEDAERHLRRVQQILLEGAYRPMTPVDLASLKTDRDGSTGLARVSFERAGRAYTASKIPLRDWSSPSYCCGDMSTEEEAGSAPCKGPPEIRSIHLDSSGMLALIEIGIVRQADGCDQGPEYFLVPVKQRAKPSRSAQAAG